MRLVNVSHTIPKFHMFWLTLFSILALSNLAGTFAEEDHEVVFRIQLGRELWAAPTLRERALRDLELDGWTVWHTLPNHSYLATGPHQSRPLPHLQGQSHGRVLSEERVHLERLSPTMKYHNALNVSSGYLPADGMGETTKDLLNRCQS